MTSPPWPRRIRHFIQSIPLERVHVLGLLLSLSIITLISLYIQQQIEKLIKQDVGQSLGTIVETTTQALTAWERILRQDVQTWATQEKTINLAKFLSQSIHSPTTKSNSLQQQQLARHLQPILLNNGYSGYFLIGPGDLYLASNVNVPIGALYRLGNKKHYLQKLWHGQTALSFPNHADFVTQKLNEASPFEKNIILAGAPVTTKDGNIIALLLLAIDPNRDFYPLLNRGRISHTGETYAIDKEGWMISPSRFLEPTSNLISIDSQDAITRSITRPSTGSAKTFQSSDNRLDIDVPLINMLKRLSNAPKGHDVEGYPDYRNILVLGNWNWINHLDIAIISEIDVSDVLETADYINTIIQGFTLFVLLLLSGIMAFFIRSEQQSSSHQKQLIRLNNLLDERVRQRTREAQSAVIAKSNFLANMSHEIRTPINGIMGMIEALSFTPLDKKQTELINTLSTSTNHLMGLLNDILDFSKLNAQKLPLENVPLELKGVMQQAIANYQHQADSKQLTITLNFAPQLAHYYLGDSLRLTQILNNLISNAIKFTEQGKIEVSAQFLEEVSSIPDLDEEQARPMATPPRWHRIQLTISDTGIGIAKEKMQDLFNSFMQSDNSITRHFGGTGLGLSICRQLTELMQGEIDVESKLGFGTTFKVTLTLPLTQIKPKEIQMPEIPKKIVPSSHLYLLVVEDHPVNQIVLMGQLQQLGMKVDVAENGQLAYELHKENHYDAIISDCHMPVMDGFTLARKISSEQTASRPRLIAVTADVLEGSLQKCLDAGFEDYLPKPCSLNALSQKLVLVTKRTVEPV